MLELTDTARRDVYREARNVLMEALTAIIEQLSAVVVIGTHALYPQLDLEKSPGARWTDDADLAVDYRLLETGPTLPALLESHHYERMKSRTGKWVRTPPPISHGIVVDLDLLAPMNTPRAGKIGANLGAHGMRSVRREKGIALCLLNNRETLLSGVSGYEQSMNITVRIAGLPAIFVAKLHKIRHSIRDAAKPPFKDCMDLLALVGTISPRALAESLQDWSRVTDNGDQSRLQKVAENEIAEALQVWELLFSFSGAEGIRVLLEACRRLDGPPLASDLVLKFSNEFLVHTERM